MQNTTTALKQQHRTLTNPTTSIKSHSGGAVKVQKRQEYVRGGIYLVDFGDKSTLQGSEQSGIRPAVVVQNDVGNKFSPTIIVAPITKSKTKKPLPTHVPIDKHYLKGLNSSYQSIALLEQIRTVDKTRVVKHLNSNLSVDKLKELDKALLVSLGF